MKIQSRTARNTRTALRRSAQRCAGGRARQSAMAEASRPSTKNVSVKLPRMNAMTSCIEVPRQCRRAYLGCDDPHGIIGFVHLRKRELGWARSAIRRVAAASVEAVVHSSTTAAPRWRGGLAKRPRSYYVPSGLRAESCAGMLLWPRRYDRLGLPHMIAPTDRMNDLFDQGRPRRQASADGARVIAIRGAREHNLKNIDLEIPRDRLVVFTGLSGSGKSSLAFDTIYAEGQRRYVESLSAYARQFLEMMQKPDVDQIDGLSPAISIEQKTTSRNPRSTVGTVTEIYDYMRLLWARVGVPYSPATGLPIESQTVSQMVDRVMALPEGTRLYLLAPVVRGRKGEYRKELADYMKRGFQRVKIDGEFYEIAEAPALDKKFKHDIDVVVDRVVVRADLATRLADSLETALKLADGLAVVEFADGAGGTEHAAGERKTAKIHDHSGPQRLIFSEKFACPVSGFTIPEIEPRLFSFNNPFGACPACGG